SAPGSDRPRSIPTWCGPRWPRWPKARASRRANSGRIDRMSIVRHWLLGMLLVIVAAPASVEQAGSNVAPPSLRLPSGARPTHYEVTLTVVPGEAKASGEIAIDVELERPHPVLWLNADDVTVSRVSV